MKGLRSQALPDLGDLYHQGRGCTRGLGFWVLGFRVLGFWGLGFRVLGFRA